MLVNEEKKAKLLDSRRYETDCLYGSLCEAKMHVNHELILAEVGRGRALSRNHTNVMSSPWPKKNVLFVATVKKQNSKQSFEIKFTNQQKFRLQTGRD